MAVVDDIYTIIVAAKAETAAAFAQVSGEMRGMVAELEQQTRLAEASFNKLEQAQVQSAARMAAAQAASTARMTAAADARTAKAAAAAEAETAAAAAAAAAAEAHARSVGVAMSNVSTSFSAVEQDLSRFKQSMMDAAIVALPVALVAGDSIKLAADYQQAMKKTEGLTGATPEDLALWNPAMIEMSKQGTQSALELAQGMFFVSSTQLHGAEALHVLTEAQQGATGGMGKMADLAQVLGGSLNAYVGQAERAANATKYMDEITQAVIQGHMDPATLAPQIGRLAPTAATMGVPFADLLAMISTGTHVGLSTSVATTGTAGILNTLGSPGASTSKGLREIGIDPLTMATRIREEGMPQVLEEIKQQMDIAAKGDDNIRARLQKEIFPNQRMGGRYFNLLTNVGGDITEEGGGGDANFFKQIDKSITNDSAGATQRANDTALTGFNAQMLVLKNNIDAVGISFANTFLPALTTFVKDLGPQIVTFLTQFANDALRLGSFLGDLGAALGNLGTMAGISIGPLQLVEGALILLGGFAIASAAVAIVGLIGDISALILALSALIFELFATGVAAVAAMGPVGILLSVMVVAVAAFAVAWANDWGGVQEVVGSAASAIGTHFLTIVSIFMPVLSLPALLKEAWDADFLGVKEIVAGVVQFVTDKLGGLYATLVSLHLVPDSWRDQWDAAKGAIADTAGNIAGGVGAAAANATAGLGDAAAKAGAAKDQIVAAMAQIRSAFDKLQGPNAINVGDAKALVDKAMADIEAAQAAAANATPPGAPAGPTAPTPEIQKTALERELLELKKQQLVVEGEMMGPQSYLRDLQFQMKEAAQEQVKLADEQRLLALDAQDFNQNADLKRVNAQIAQQQDALRFTTSPTEAGALDASIKTLERKAFAIRQSLIPDDNTRLEATLTQSGDALNVKIAQNQINQQIAQVNDSLAPLELQKKDIDEATKLVQHQQAVDALTTKVDPSSKLPGGGLPITPRADAQPAGAVGPGNWTEAPVDGPTEPAPPVSNQSRDSWSKPQATYSQHTYHVTLNNPVLTSEQSQDDVLAYLQAGLEAADAQGVPLAATGTDVH